MEKLKNIKTEKTDVVEAEALDEQLDFSPKHPNLVKSHRRTKFLHKGYDVPKNGLVMTPEGLAKAFFKEIRTQMPPSEEFVRNRPSGPESQAACIILDYLAERRCQDEAHVMEWIRWYIKVHLARKTTLNHFSFRLKYMAETWEEFRRVMSCPDSKTFLPRGEPIFDSMKKIIGDDGIKVVGYPRCVYEFGVLLTAAFLVKHAGWAEQDAFLRIDDALNRFKKEGLDRHYAYVMTKVFYSDKLLNSDFPFVSCWVDKFGFGTTEKEKVVKDEGIKGNFTDEFILAISSPVR